MNIIPYLTHVKPWAPTSYTISGLWKRVEHLTSLLAAINLDLSSEFVFQKKGESFHLLVQKKDKSQGGVDLFEALTKSLPSDWVENEKLSWGEAEKLNFSSPMEAMVYTAFKEMRVQILPEEPGLPKRTPRIQSTPLCFLEDPVLSQMMLSADLSGKPDSTFLRMAKACQSLTQLLSSKYSAAAAQQVQRELLKLKGRGANDPSFEKEHHHGWVAWAIAHGQPEWIEPLLALGGSAFQDHKGVSPLAAALLTKNHHALSILLKNSVSPDTYLSSPGAKGEALQGLTEAMPALIFTALLSDEKAVQILLQAGACPSLESDTCITALEVAARNGNEEMVRMLVQFEADLSHENSNGVIPSEMVPEGQDDLFQWMEDQRQFPALRPESRRAIRPC